MIVLQFEKLSVFTLVKVVGLFVGVLDIDSDEQSAFTDVELPELHPSLLKYFLK